MLARSTEDTTTHEDMLADEVAQHCLRMLIFFILTLVNQLTVCARSNISACDSDMVVEPLD